MKYLVAVLFARERSVYHSIAVCDVYDRVRGARTWSGGVPVVAHPPCAQWGSLRSFAHRVPEQLALAPWAIEQVRRYGGVVEHPGGSLLWRELDLPAPGAGVDQCGGWTLGIEQREFGHRARKRTLLYIVGCAPRDIPGLPLSLHYATHRVKTDSRSPVATRRRHLELSAAGRQTTPAAMARWLVALALGCR